MEMRKLCVLSNEEKAAVDLRGEHSNYVGEADRNRNYDEDQSKNELFDERKRNVS